MKNLLNDSIQVNSIYIFIFAVVLMALGLLGLLVLLIDIIKRKNKARRYANIEQSISHDTWRVTLFIMDLNSGVGMEMTGITELLNLGWEPFAVSLNVMYFKMKIMNKKVEIVNEKTKTQNKTQ